MLKSGFAWSNPIMAGTRAAACALAAFLFCGGAFGYEKVDFSSRPLTAGSAAIVDGGYVVGREIGTANFTPELRYPVEFVYNSKREKNGLFGFAWHSPQLESSAAWDKDGMLWTSPWGEKFKFFPKDEKAPKGAIKLDPIDEAKKGGGFYSPYAEWEANTAAADPMSARDWTITGKRAMKGWRFVYADSRLSSITAPSGRSVEFRYDASGRPVAISQEKTSFVEIAYNDAGNVASVADFGIIYVRQWLKNRR